MLRTVAAAEVARALGLSADSIGRYARAGRVPFDVTPGGHRRFDVEEVRLALGSGGGHAASRVFRTPSATVRRRAIRSVTTSAAAVVADRGSAGVPGAESGLVPSGAGTFVTSAWRVQRSVPLTSA